jgi:hypothetical protein
MTDIFHVRTVAANRKRRVCDWCGEPIEAGEPYTAYRWRNRGDAGSCYMHPECIEASKRAAEDVNDPLYEFSPGDFSRGCTCAHGDCRCEKEREQ